MPKNINRILKQTQYRKDPYFHNQRSQFTYRTPEEKSFNCIDKASITNILSRDIEVLINASCLFSNPLFPTVSHTSHWEQSQIKLIQSTELLSPNNSSSSETTKLVDTATQTLLSQDLDILEDPSQYNPELIPFYTINPDNKNIINVSLLIGAFQPFHLPNYYKPDPPTSQNFSKYDQFDIRLKPSLPSSSFEEYEKYVQTQSEILTETHIDPKRYKTTHTYIKPEFD